MLHCLWIMSLHHWMYTLYTIQHIYLVLTCTHLSNFLFWVQGVIKIVHALNYHKHVIHTLNPILHKIVRV